MRDIIQKRLSYDSLIFSLNLIISYFYFDMKFKLCFLKKNLIGSYMILIIRYL